jgi:hypothetical protein
MTQYEFTLVNKPNFLRGFHGRKLEKLMNRSEVEGISRRAREVKLALEFGLEFFFEKRKKEFRKIGECRTRIRRVRISSYNGVALLAMPRRWGTLKQPLFTLFKKLSIVLSRAFIRILHYHYNTYFSL